MRSKILKRADFCSDKAQNAVNPDGLTSILTKYERKSAFSKLSSDCSLYPMALTDESIAIDDKRISCYNKLAVVMGSEGEGLTPKTISECDHTVKIPMYHGVDSLNVAAASAVAFWELRKK